MANPPTTVAPRSTPIGTIEVARQAARPPLMEYPSPTAALIARPVPLASRYPMLAIAVMFAAAVAVVALLPIDRVVVAMGKVVAERGNLSVQPLDVALVRRIDVQEGELVHKGDVMAELDPTIAQADETSLVQQVASLQAEVDRLTAETQHRTYLPDGSPASQLQALLFAQRRAQLSFNLEEYEQKIDEARVKQQQAASDVASYTERLGLATQVEDKRKELARLQVGSVLDLLQATDTRVDTQSRLNQARSDELAARRELAAEIAERDNAVQKWQADTSQQLTDQGRKLSDARQDLEKATLKRHLVQLRAEQDAIVLRVAPVSVGTVMQSGQDFIELVPLDAPLQIEAMVDGRDVGFVRPGDPVTLKFDTFPYTLYGTARGTVRSISPDSYKDPNDKPTAAQAAGTRTAEAVGTLLFRTRVAIDEMQLHDLPRGARVVPGMPVQADIKVGRRTVLRYLMSRFVPATAEGMREP